MDVHRARHVELSLVATISLTLLSVAWYAGLPTVESLGFITGLACVYLVVRQDVRNFPLGIANNIFLFIVFANSRLFADAGLQIVYLVLGVHGWHAWLHGGAKRQALSISNAPKWLSDALALAVIIATPLLASILYRSGGAAPLLDALTTTISLAAQVLLNRKHIQTWTLWITADVLYIYLYLQRDLYLTALLYSFFLLLCFVGLAAWQRELRNTSQTSA